MSIDYETDIVAWADEQAALLRAGKFSAIDIEHVADEVEDVGKTERRELSSRMAVLLGHLLKWGHQPDRRSKSWRDTIRIQRRAIVRHLAGAPSLRRSLANPTWLAGAWDDAVARAMEETGLGLSDFPEACPWSADDILDPDFMPG